MTKSGLTIAEAAAEVLKDSNLGMQVQEITTEILNRGLYEFNAKDHVGMVRNAMDRRSENAKRSNAKPPLFAKAQDGKYKLLAKKEK
jgi:HB1, ASXL, restriction endonuclease HTH domain